MAIYNYLNETGVIVPDAGAINTDVQDEYKNTFGQDLVTSPNTPQGLLIISETLARIAVADNNAALANQINPNLAGGVFLDAIIALTNPAGRTPATPSTLTATLNGIPGTIIPAGSQASETGSGNANVFQTIITVTIGSGGAITDVAFASVEDGQIPANAGTLTTIISSILGWESITDSTQAVLGSQTQSDVSARQFRLNTLASQGVSLPEAITSALFNVGCISLSFIENISGSTQTIEGVTMVGNSIYVCVQLGANTTLTQVANALIASKSAGAAYNNGPGVNQSVTVVVPFSGQSMDVLFDTPNPINVYVNVSVVIITPIQDPAAAIQQAILNYVAGLVDGVVGLGVGSNVSPFEISGAIAIQFPGVYVQSLQISLSPGSGFAATEIVIQKYQIANIPLNNIVVVVL